MSKPISRRKLITTGLTAAAGLAGAARLADRYGLIPPDHGGLYGIGETLTYGSLRLLTYSHSMAREFSRDQISRFIPVNGDPPQTAIYQRLLAGGFADWRLKVDGLVDRPSLMSLADLKGYPKHTQITHQGCEEGWSFIAEWTGAALSHVLGVAGVQPQAKYVVYYAFDDRWESLDMHEAFHPQTLVAYGMNGGDLPADYGAPVRMRVPRQLGYKSVKFLSRITVTDSLKNLGEGLGSQSPEVGYSWYAGI